MDAALGNNTLQVLFPTSDHQGFAIDEGRNDAEVRAFRLAHQLLKMRLAADQRLIAQILAVQLEQIEPSNGSELLTRIWSAPSRVDRVRLRI